MRYNLNKDLPAKTRAYAGRFRQIAPADCPACEKCHMLSEKQLLGHD